MPEDLVVRYCAPTLAGLKTGSMFTCRYATRAELQRDIREMNHRLRHKGLRVLPLRYRDHLALIYFYRPGLLSADLEAMEAVTLLEDMGYPVGSLSGCVAMLIHRLQHQEEFPHEIGLFLGYPPEDVLGFIENRAADCKCVGTWKVYGDEAAARVLFRKYRKCTEVYASCLKRGFSMERLAVAAR